MDYINIQGDENTIISELSAYVSQGGAKLIVQNLPFLTDVLGDDEAFEVRKEKQEQENGLGFMVPKTNSIIMDDGKYTLSGTPKCMNFALGCSYRQYDKCCLSNDVLHDTVQKLLDEKIIKGKGNLLIYCF